MKLLHLVLFFFLVSCTNKYSDVKNLVQENCERYLDSRNIVVEKRQGYFRAFVLNDSIYTDVYYFIVFGSKKDEVITIADENKYYWLNDSLCLNAINVNRILAQKEVEIGEIYVDGVDDFSVRARAKSGKYIYRVVKVKKLEELIGIDFGSPLIQ